METTVYVHLTEERGYYLPFRPGEPATVSETNTASGGIFIAVGGLRNLSWRCRRSIVRDGRTSAHALSELTPTYHAHCSRFPAIHHRSRVHRHRHRQLCACSVLATAHSLWQGRGRGRWQASFIFIPRPQLDGSLAAVAVASRRTTWLEYAPPTPPLRPTSLCQLPNE